MSSPLERITVSEVMSLVVYSTSPDNTVAEAYGLLHGKHLGGLPVTENGKLVGIITHKDFKQVNFDNRNKTKVKDIMSKEVITTQPDERVSDRHGKNDQP